MPFFFYVLHLAFIHGAAIALNLPRYGRTSFLLLPSPSLGSPAQLFPSNYGFPLWVVYATWTALLGALYPACLWFGRLKQRHHAWWLSYL